MKAGSWAAILVLVLGGVAQAQSVTQSYERLDGAPVLASEENLWMEKDGGKGVGKYYTCKFVAKKAATVLREDNLIYFANAPIGGDSDKSNQWVYWYNVKGGKSGIIWGRCPTKNHPEYKKWEKETKDKDLWQIMEKPALGFDVKLADLKKYAEGFGSVMSSRDEKAPTVAPREAVIQCVNLENVVFRYKGLTPPPLP